MKTRFFDKLMTRLDKLDPGSLQTQFLRLAKEKGLLETIFQVIREGLIVLDHLGNISYANPAAEKLLGFKLENAEGNPIKRYLKEIDWDLVLNLDEGEWSKLVSREIETNYPEHRFLNFYLVPLNVEDATDDGVALILRDVTHERKQEVHNQESARLSAITLLAGGVAHEIGNPLNSLNIHLQLIGRELEFLPEGEKKNFAELLEVARAEVERLDQIINQFLGAIRPQPPDMMPADLGEVVQDTVVFMKTEIADRGILAEVDIPDEVPTVSVDKDQIKQAFFNLIKNAIQVMCDGGLLKITVGHTDRFVTVSFKDTGPGIKAEDLGAIFEPYHTTKPEGSGLGLMIVQRIMRDHGGEIEIDSEPDKGATVTLYFNRDEARIRLLRAPQSEDEPVTTQTGENG